MTSFHYEWYTVQALFYTGTYTLEVKAKNKDGAVRQFKKMLKDDPLMIKIDWYSFKLDRIGHQR